MIYPFTCPVHGYFEINMKMSEAEGTHKCPICNTDSPRVYTVPEVTFRGGGWGSKKSKTIDPTGKDWEKRRQKEKWI
jgi:putative FmdB family regulatory protein